MAKFKIEKKSKSHLIFTVAIIVVVGIATVVTLMVAKGKKKEITTMTPLYGDQQQHSPAPGSPEYEQLRLKANQEKAANAQQSGGAFMPAFSGENEQEKKAKKEEAAGLAETEKKGSANPGDLKLNINLPDQDPALGAHGQYTPARGKRFQGETTNDTDTERDIRDKTIDKLDEKIDKFPKQDVGQASNFDMFKWQKDIAPKSEPGSKDQNTNAVATASENGAPTSTTKTAKTTRIPKGTQCWGSIDSYINTDKGGMIQASLFSCAGVKAKFANAKLFGNIKRNNEVIALTFDVMNYNGAGVAVKAVAMDEDTATSALEGEVDRHYFTRWILPLFLDTAAGIGEAASRSGTTVTGPDGVSVTTQNGLSYSSEVKVGVGKGVAGIAKKIEQEFQGNEKTVRTKAGKSIGIIFLEDAIL